MKLPDLFYIKQARALNNLHAFSVNLLSSLNRRNNPQNAYDSEWGSVQIENLTISVQKSQLKPETIARILRRKIKPSGFLGRPELDHDLLRMEVLQANLEYELVHLNARKAALLGWIHTALLIGILAMLTLSYFTHQPLAPQSHQSGL